MAKNNFYTYISFPTVKERDEIRDKYFDLQELRISNDEIFRPEINFDAQMLFSKEVISIFEKQIPWEYSALINEELFKLEVQFLQFIHYYHSAQMNTDNTCMYRPLLNMSVESYIIGLSSIKEKIVLMTVNLVLAEELYKENKNKYTSKNHSTIIKDLKSQEENYPSLKNLIISIENYHVILKTHKFDDVRNNAIHNLSDLQMRFGFSKNDFSTTIQAPHSNTSYGKIINSSKLLYPYLKQMISDFGALLVEKAKK